MPSNYQIIENQITKAFNAYKRDKKQNIAALAREFKVPDRRLRRRIANIPPRPATRSKFTPSQETAIKEWIERQSSYGVPPTASLIRDFANSILAKQDSESQVSKMWSYRFLQRLSPEFKHTKQRSIDPKRLQSEDIGVIQTWYDRLKITIQKNHIRQENIWNFDETGVQIGKEKIEKVVVTRSKPYISLPSLDGEQVPILECISAGGSIIPPCVVFKGQGQMETLYSEELPEDWLIGVSSTGYSNDQIAYKWIEHFHKHTKPAKNENRLLLLGGHGSYLTADLLIYCEERAIIPFLLPSHTTHFLQPLDGKPFQQYKHFHGREISKLAQGVGIESISKGDFLHLLPTIRDQAFTPRTIRAGFKDSGIHPLNPKLVIDQLHEYRALTPELTGREGSLADEISSTHSTSIPSSPTNVQRLEQDIREVQSLLRASTKVNNDIQRELNKILRSGITQETLLHQREQDLTTAINIRQRQDNRPNTRRRV